MKTNNKDTVSNSPHADSDHSPNGVTHSDSPISNQATNNTLAHLNTTQTGPLRVSEDTHSPFGSRHASTSPHQMSALSDRLSTLRLTSPLTLMDRCGLDREPLKEQIILIGERHDDAGGLLLLYELSKSLPNSSLHLEISHKEHLERLWSIGDNELECAKRCSILLNLAEDRLRTHDVDYRDEKYWLNPSLREAKMVSGLLKEKDQCIMLVDYLHIQPMVMRLKQLGVEKHDMRVLLPTCYDLPLDFGPLKEMKTIGFYPMSHNTED